MISHYDLYPTILDYAGIRVDNLVDYPGRSFKPLLEGKSIDGQDLVIFDEYGPNRMIRTDRYKLIIRYDGHQNELYDLQLDPTEKYNLLLTEFGNDLEVGLNARLEAWFSKFSTAINDGRETRVTGFGQYDQLQASDQPFERIEDFYKD